MKHREKVDALLDLALSRSKVQHVIDATYVPGQAPTVHRALLMDAQNGTRDMYQRLYREVRDAKVRR